MLGNQIVDAKVENKSGTDNEDIYISDVQHKMLINWTPPDEKKFFLRRRFGSCRMFNKSLPRRNKNLFRYKMSGSLNLNPTSGKSSWQKSSNSSLDSSSDPDKSSRDLSRSAKIMKALSLNQSLIRHVNVDIKKSLNFDSPPSAKKASCFDQSPQSDSTSLDTSFSPTFNKLLSYDGNSLESVSSSVLIASSESIDENQNQTPQKTRRAARVSSSSSSAKENLNHSSDSSGSTSLLRSNLKERIDNILHIVQTPELQSRKRSKILGYVASTPRNLFQEFDQDEHGRPRTPENIIRLIPESMSAIKKSHRKEKLYRPDDLSTQQTDPSANKDFHIKTGTESSEVDEIIAGDSCDMSSIEMKKRSFKKTLTYDSDDELSDRSVSDHSALWNKTTSREDDSSRNDTSTDSKGRKVQDINFSDCENREERIRQNDDNVHFVGGNDRGEQPLDENDDCDKEVRLSLSQGESSSAANANVSCENDVVPSTSTSNPAVPQNASRAVTPENHINILQQIFTESIKKSHKKVKYENKKIFQRRSLQQKVEFIQDARNDSNIAACLSASQTSARPNTPDNINSSRLLLTQFHSVKKSHKKEKYNKKISSLAKYQKYQEFCKKNEDSMRSNRSRQADISGISYKDSSVSFELKDLPNVSPSKKQNSPNVSAQSEACSSLCSESSSLGCKNIEDEFSIPIKRISLRLFSSSNANTDDSVKKSQSEQAAVTPEAVDFSRSITPIARCSRKSTGYKDALSKGDAPTDESKIDACVSRDGLANTIDPTDKNGRSTPTNMSTMELFSNIDSIKKSHKKNKHGHGIFKRGGKRPSHNQESKNVSFANSTTATLEEQASSALQLSSASIGTGMCSNTHDKDGSYEEINYDDPQPSTSRTSDSIRNITNVTTSNILNVTPPNNVHTASFVTLYNTTSIKKFHKKERDFNAETKYILMSSEHDLSDDGSIFDEEDRLSGVENLDSCQDSGKKMYT